MTDCTPAPGYEPTQPGSKPKPDSPPLTVSGELLHHHRHHPSLTRIGLDRTAVLFCFVFAGYLAVLVVLVAMVILLCLSGS